MGLSLFFARIVDPVADPKNGILRVVVLDLDIPFLDFAACSVRGIPPLGRRSGEVNGETVFVVVKNPKTLSATILILALALLWVLLR